MRQTSTMTGADADAAPDTWRGPLYVDASALARLYLPGAHSEELEARLTGRRDLLVSELAITEISAAFARRRLTGEVTEEATRSLRDTILADVDDGHFMRVELSAAAHREAERLLLSASVALRAADALHLALAILAGASGVVTFDSAMIAATAPLGINTFPTRAG